MADEFQKWLNNRYKKMNKEKVFMKKRCGTKGSVAIRDLQEKMYELSTVMAIYKEFKRGNSIQGD